MRPNLREVKQWRLVAFDLDGTLVKGTSTCQHLSDCFGHGDIIREIQSKHAQGAITNRQVAEADAKYYAGKRTDEVHSAMSTISLIAGIEDTFSILRSLQAHLILATLTWSFAAKVIAERFRLDAWSGCRMGESESGVLNGTVAAHFDELDKRAFVEEYCARHGIPMDEVIAVGDSRLDIPLFSAVGYSIAINATQEAQQAASCAIDTDDLRDVLKVIPGIGRKISGR